ncbi:MAG: hypothetical protein M3252_04360 [Actinomycetota bacterium]|nr:hypothetical protein [Actinomycetota bacterium]
MTEVVNDSGRRPHGEVAHEWRRRALRPGWALGGHVLTLMSGLAVLVVAGAGQWFVIDEWVFLTDRRLDDVRGLFVPHNEHWSTLPIVLWRGLFAAVGLRSYWPYLLAALAVHVGVAHLLWRVQRRAGVMPGVAIATSGLFLVFGAGAENMLSAFAVTFNASLLLGLGHVLLVDHEGRFDRRDLWGLVLALGGLLSSGVAVTMVGVAGLVAFLRRGWRAGLVTVGPPAVVLVIWMLLIGRIAMGALRWEPQRIVAFAWYGLNATFDVAASATGVGVVALVGLALWLLRHRDEVRGRIAAPAACAVGAVVFFSLIGIGRSIGQVELSRYLYVAAALLIPAVGGALSDLTVNRRLARAGAVVLVALFAANGTRLLFARAAAERAIEQQQRVVLLAAARMDLPPSELVLPEPVGLAHMLTYSELRQMRQRGQLPSDDDVSREDELAALAILHIGVSPTPHLPVGPQQGGPTTMTTGPDPRPRDSAGLESNLANSGCLHFQAKAVPSDVLIHVPAPVALPLYTGADTVDVFLRDVDGTTSPVGLEFQIWHSPTYLNLNLHERDIVLTLPAGVSSTLCGLGGR